MMLTCRFQHLAQQITAEHEAASSAAKTAIEHAVKCGELLLDAKTMVGHGGWYRWVEVNVPIGIRQVQKYMRLAEKGLLNASSDSHLTIEGALAALAEQSSPQMLKRTDDSLNEFIDATGDLLIQAIRKEASAPDDLKPIYEKARRAISNALQSFAETSAATVPEERYQHFEKATKWTDVAEMRLGEIQFHAQRRLDQILAERLEMSARFPKLPPSGTPVEGSLAWAYQNLVTAGSKITTLIDETCQEPARAALQEINNQISDTVRLFEQASATEDLDHRADLAEQAVASLQTTSASMDAYAI